MHHYLKAFLFFAVLFAASYAARIVMTPGVMPVADNEQPSGEFLTAFILKSMENVGLYGTIIVFLFGIGWALSGLARSAKR